MREENSEVLSMEQVNSILERAWALSSSTKKDKEIQELKVSDWDIFSSDLEILFKSSDYVGYKLPTPTGETFSDLVGKNITKKVRSLYLVVLFILIKEGRINENDKESLPKFLKHRNYFLQKCLEELNIKPEIVKDKEIKKSTIIVGENKEVAVQQEPKPSYFQNYKFYWPTLVGILLLIIGFAFWENYGPKALTPPKDDDPRIKLIYKSITTEKSPPYDIQFEYDISGIRYDKAYIDFGTSEQPIIEFLDSPKGRILKTFTHPQTRDIKVVLDGKTKVFLLTLKSNEWIVLLDNLYETPIKRNGILHYPVDKVPGSIIKDGEFYLRYQNINDFDSVDADNMTFETRLKNPHSEGGISCFDVGIDLNGEWKQKRGILSFNLLSKGCERFAGITVGETKLPLKTSKQKLTNSGLDLSDWVVVKSTTNNQILKIFVDDKLLHTVPYQGKIGKLKFMQILFKGSGSVDWVKISSLDKKILYYEDFD
jgi:hypothetical protein